MLAVAMHKHINKENVVFFALSYLIVHFFLLTIPLNNYSFSQGIRFIIAKTLPFILYFSLFYQREIRVFLNVKPFKKLAQFSINITLLIAGLSLFGGLIIGADFPFIFHLKWSYAAAISWLCATGLFYALLRSRDVSKLESLILSILISFVGGLIYELPIYPFLDLNSGIIFHYTFPFLVANQILFLPLLFFYFKKHFVFSGNSPLFFLFSMCLFAFGLIYMQNTGDLKTNWLPRLPTIFYLAFLLKSLKIRRRDAA